ncbi:Ldh family oxidoreductase [Thermosediminibacter oceani]|uniref:Malate/L-lactate dehydrogenase n=1 Tax=Thermosediminibacter oceani (strain ATCC BAA-1034 / DSM 16646 / JW/IW-1228P) TaxID=555079 RepID=D9RZ74_THEOJ|nr:Ldh family oxidoreductase [Thermosediminibacter oceani]ADL08628.1 Malate/L-lactate dehydrogenase [Thermosediminibacter oceani DSM 16646]
MPKIIDADKLKKLEIEIFKKTGFKEQDAKIIAESLIYSDLRGIESHGISNLPIYVKRAKLGLYNLSGDINVLNLDKDIPLLLIDGNNTMGQIAAYKSVEPLLNKAKKSGIAAAFIGRTNHCGSLGFYGNIVADNGCIFIGMTNAPASMAPWGGKVKFVGTNPLCITIPYNDQVINLDMATSTVAKGKIYVELSKGNKIPDNWALNADGKPTTDPKEALKGTLYPLGGYKGFGLAMLIDIIAGLLTGSSWGPDVGSLHNALDRGQDLGIVFIAINISELMPINEYNEKITRYIEKMKSVPKSDDNNEIMFPGEPELRRIEERLKNGVPINDQTYEEVIKIAKEYDIDFEE